jgi:predicted ATPase/transcriptional regulator with XRE-family HTH domain/Tfp pilus assembly protein PilF
MSSTVTFRRWLKERRKALDFTQEDLADLTGCSIWTIRKIEMGDRKPSRQVAELLADALRIPDEERSLFVQSARADRGNAQPPSVRVEAVRSLPGHLTNLPIPPTRLIGREADLEKVGAHLVSDDVRLLTLTGPPGTGKTRLALEAASLMLAHFEDGVFFVPLAPISDPHLVAPTIAQVLGLKESAGQPLEAALIQHLRGKRLLLVLDNFEQVLSVAHLVADLLSGCHYLKLLVTSREALHLRVERLFNVPALATPKKVQRQSVEDMLSYPAVSLFVERAQAVSHFGLTDENIKAVAAICNRLDGLPLAIELVAARSRLLPPPGVLARLTGVAGRTSLDLATGRVMDLPTRHQTLRNALEWSYELLEAREQKLFARLGIFAGGCTLAAAEAVCNPKNDLGLDMLSGFESLLDKSLFRQEGRAEEEVVDEPRFGMLETIREYARERLEQSGEANRVHRWHAEYFLALSEAAEPELRGPRQREWLERLEADYANLRSAIRWTVESGAEELGLRLVGALQWFWFVRGYVSEGRARLAEALAPGSDPEQEPSRGEQGDEYLEARLKAFRGAGLLAHVQGDFSAARTYFTSCLAIARALEDKEAIANQLNSLGNVARAQGDYTEAKHLQEESLATHRVLGNKHGMAASLNNLGNVLEEQGRYDEARPRLEEALALYRELGDKVSIGIALNSLGAVLLAQGYTASARALFEESLAIRHELGDRLGTGLVLFNLGNVICDEGDYQTARRFYVQSLELNQELGNKRGITQCLEGLAKVDGLRGELEEAVRLWGAADTLRTAIGNPVSPGLRAKHEPLLTSLRSQLGEVRFACLWTEGQNISLEQVIGRALGPFAPA